MVFDAFLACLFNVHYLIFCLWSWICIFCYEYIWKKVHSMIFKNSLSASWLVRELSSPRLDWPRVGLSANCPVSAFAIFLQVYFEIWTRELFRCVKIQCWILTCVIFSISMKFFFLILLLNSYPIHQPHIMFTFTLTSQILAPPTTGPPIATWPFQTLYHYMKILWLNYVLILKSNVAVKYMAFLYLLN